MNEAGAMQKLQQAITLETSRILKDQLIGIYAHGSWAFGCFCWETSDFDYLIVIRDTITAEQKRALLDATWELAPSAPPKGLEMSVVTVNACRNPRHPVPFLLHSSPLHNPRYRQNPAEYIEQMTGTDPDLAAYFAVIRQCGVVLRGAPIPQVFGEISPSDLLASLQNNLEDSDEPSAVLNRCRFKAYQETGTLLSKPDGAAWAFSHADAAERRMIRLALKSAFHSTVKLLSANELTPELFDGFHRHQEVTECWRKENGNWVLKPIAFVEEWDRSRLGAFCEELKAVLQTGGVVPGVFAANRLIGFAALKSEFFGQSRRYLEVSELHVSEEWRGCGVGRKLFLALCEKARAHGADHLYISAHSSRESQAFYHAVGCCEAREYNARLAAAEPCDCQLEYALFP